MWSRLFCADLVLKDTVTPTSYTEWPCYWSKSGLYFVSCSQILFHLCVRVFVCVFVCVCVCVCVFVWLFVIRPSSRKLLNGAKMIYEGKEAMVWTSVCVNIHGIYGAIGGCLPKNYCILDSLRLILVHSQILGTSSSNLRLLLFLILFGYITVLSYCTCHKCTINNNNYSIILC